MNTAASSDEKLWQPWFMVLPEMFPFLMFASIFPFSITLFSVRNVAVMSVLNGNDFRYPVLGTKVEQFLTD